MRENLQNLKNRFKFNINRNSHSLNLGINFCMEEWDMWCEKLHYNRNREFYILLSLIWVQISIGFKYFYKK